MMLLITQVLHTLLQVVVVLSLSFEVLGENEAPVTLLYRETKSISFRFIAAIAIFSVLNDALMKMIRGSRVLYGIAGQV